MATTATEILTAAQALGYATDTETAQLALLNQVHQRIINARRWRFLMSETTKVTVAGTATVAFDTLAGTQRLDSVRLERGTEFVDLDYVSPEEIRQYDHMARSTSTPEFWSRIGANIVLWPIPDLVYTLKIGTVENPVKIAAGGTNVQVPDSHSMILVWGLAIGVTFRERDWDAHNMARQTYAELFAEMLAQYGQNQRQMSSHVESSGFHEHYEVESGWPGFDSL